MIYLGIDPGRSGAFALFDKNELTVQTFDMPPTLAGVHELIAGLPVIRGAMVEKPYYPHMIGTKNVAAIAENYGALKSALLWRDIPTFDVTPSTWKRALNLGPYKDESRNRASQFFPGNADQWARKKDDGRAEAALIAWYGQGVIK